LHQLPQFEGDALQPAMQAFCGIRVDNTRRDESMGPAICVDDTKAGLLRPAVYADNSHEAYAVFTALYAMASTSASSTS
jgi:hypothetical protein